jgi:hypothetical protein
VPFLLDEVALAEDLGLSVVDLVVGAMTLLEERKGGKT